MNFKLSESIRKWINRSNNQKSNNKIFIYYEEENITSAHQQSTDQSQRNQMTKMIKKCSKAQNFEIQKNL